MKIDEALALIKPVPNFPHAGILFQDITPLLSHPEGFSALVHALSNLDNDSGCIVAIEARGFIIGAALALHRGVGFVPVRKRGKLPRSIFQEQYSLEYGDDCLEIHQDAFAEGSHALIVDDVLATGGTISAAINLIKKAGGTVNKVVVLVEIAELHGRQRLQAEHPHITIESLLTV